MTRLPLLIQIAGVLHFTLLLAGASAANVLQWKTELRRLADLSRQMIWVHGVFIVLTIIGFGVIALTQAHALAAGDSLARAIAAFIALFWLVRLFVQFFVFNAKPHLTTVWLAVAYHALTIVFAYFVLVFAYTALR